MITQKQIDQKNIDEILKKLKFNDQGLIIAIAQDFQSHKVLMQAWMNIESIKQTLTSGLATYFSRSRNEIWQKGKTSGNFQKIILEFFVNTHELFIFLFSPFWNYFF